MANYVTWVSDRRYRFEHFSTSGAGLDVRTMAPHSSTLAWKIPWVEEPGRL